MIRMVFIKLVNGKAEEFDAVDQARAWPTEIGRGVDQKCALRQVGGWAPLAWLLHHPQQLCLRAVNGKTAGHHDEEIRGRVQDLIPRHNPRGATRLREDILAAGELDHLRNPMTCDVEGRKPFDADHAGALGEALDTSADGV